MNKGNYGLAKNRTYKEEQVASPNRYIYSYQGIGEAAFNYTAEYGGDWMTNVFDLIQTSHSNIFQSGISGQYKFNNFDDLFQRGKSFKIKGNILFRGTNNASTILNMRFGFSDPENTKTILALNNGNLTSHYPPNKAIGDYIIPLNFEIILLNATNPAGAHGIKNTRRAQANGFYQYNYTSISQSGQENVYVPMCHDIYNNGDTFWVDVHPTKPLKFHLDFKNSDIIDTLFFTYLNVEVYER